MFAPELDLISSRLVHVSPTPSVFQNLGDGVTLIHFAVEHRLDQIDRRLAHDPGNAQLVVHDLVDTVKGILLVDERVEKDPESPDVLLPPTIGFALQHLGRCIICMTAILVSNTAFYSFIQDSGYGGPYQ